MWLTLHITTTFLFYKVSDPLRAVIESTYCVRYLGILVVQRYDNGVTVFYYVGITSIAYRSKSVCSICSRISGTVLVSTFELKSNLAIISIFALLSLK